MSQLKEVCNKPIDRFSSLEWINFEMIILLLNNNTRNFINVPGPFEEHAELSGQVTEK